MANIYTPSMDSSSHVVGESKLVDFRIYLCHRNIWYLILVSGFWQDYLLNQLDIPKKKQCDVPNRVFQKSLGFPG